MRPRFDTPAALVALAAVFAMAVARGWLCDDAFITFRVVEQMARGEGPVFNVGERVQVFTHPLWMFVLAAWSALGGTLRPGAIGLSLVVFGVGLVAYARAFRDRPLTLALVLLAFFGCRTLVDYASGGLETPLAFALAMLAVWGVRAGRRGLALAALALLPLTRADLLFFALPFVFAIPARDMRDRLLQLAAFAAPTAAWMAFSTVYYGVPVPNTAFAKLAGPAAQRWDPGVAYVVGSLLSDPGAMALTVTGLAVGIARRRRDGLVRAAFFALLLSLAYAAWAGGDFMLGRFLLPTLWAALIGLAAALPAPRGERADVRWLASLVATLAFAHAMTGHTTLRTQLGLRDVEGHEGPWYPPAVDERRFYLPWLGLFPTERFPALAVRMGSAWNTSPRVAGAMGVAAYARPRDEAVVDYLALAEPFLARLQPVAVNRPGHAFRPLPEGFLLWRDPTHHFADARLDALAADLRLAHRSPDLFTVERAAALWRLLRLRPLDAGAIEMQRAGDVVRLAVRPRMLIRLQDPPGRGVTWTSRDCMPGATPYRGGDLVEASTDGASRIECPARDFDRIPFHVHAGTIAAGTPPVVKLDEGIPIVRENFTWLRDLPRWAVAGHGEGSLLPSLVALVLLVIAAILVKMSRNSTGAIDPWPRRTSSSSSSSR